MTSSSSYPQFPGPRVGQPVVEAKALIPEETKMPVATAGGKTLKPELEPEPRLGLRPGQGLGPEPERG